MSAVATTSASAYKVKCLYKGCSERFYNVDARENHMLSSHPYQQIDPNVLFSDGRVYPMSRNGKDWVCPCLHFASTSTVAVKAHALLHPKPTNTEYYKKPAPIFNSFIQPQGNSIKSGESESDDDSDTNSILPVSYLQSDSLAQDALSRPPIPMNRAISKQNLAPAREVGIKPVNKRLTRATAPKGRNAHKLRSTKGIMREHDLGSYRLFRVGEIVWASLYQSIGSVWNPHISHWPCIIKSSEFRILAPQYQQQQYYVLIPLGLNEDQKLKYPSSKLLPYSAYRPSARLRQLMNTNYKFTVHKTQLPKMSELDPATNAGYFYSVGVQIAAHVSQFISLEAPYNVKQSRPSRKRAKDMDGDVMDDDYGSALVTDSEGEPTEGHIASYTGCWLGNERIWKGDYIRLKQCNRLNSLLKKNQQHTPTNFEDCYIRVIRFYVESTDQGKIAMVCGTPHAIRKLRLDSSASQKGHDYKSSDAPQSPNQAIQSLSLNPDGYLTASQVLDYPLSQQYLPVPPDQHEFYPLTVSDVIMAGRMSDIAGRWYPNGGNGLWKVEESSECKATLLHPNRSKILAIGSSNAFYQAEKLQKQ